MRAERRAAGLPPDVTVPHGSPVSVQHGPSGAVRPTDTRDAGVGQERPLYRLTNWWNGGTLQAVVAWEGEDPGEAFRWVHDHTPFAWSSIEAQGYLFERIR